jgi:hypothetical protein
VKGTRVVRARDLLRPKRHQPRQTCRPATSVGNVPVLPVTLATSGGSRRASERMSTVTSIQLGRSPVATSSAPSPE